MANRDSAILSSESLSALFMKSVAKAAPRRREAAPRRVLVGSTQGGGDILRCGSIFILLLEPLHRVIVDRWFLALSYLFSLSSASCSDKRFEDLSAARDFRARLLAFRYERYNPGAKHGGPVSQDLDCVECTCGVPSGCVEPVLIAAELGAHEDPRAYPRDHVEHI